MFKKPIKTAAQNQLSGKDKKFIKNKLTDLFDPDCVEKVFLNNEKIICTKVSGSKMQIFFGEDYPLFVDGTGKDDFFPSLYLCAAYLPILHTVTLNEGVETYIFNGANLMWPGVNDVENIGGFKKDQVVAIRTSKGETVAVGAMGCSYQEFKKAEDNSGIAVFVLHFRGDKLWEMGTKVYPQSIIGNREKKENLQKPTAGLDAKIQKVQQPKKEEAKPKNEQIKPKKKVESSQKESSGDEADFGSLIHAKKQKIAPIKMEKKVMVFSDEEDNGKKKKKQPKKGKKKQSSDEEEETQQKPVKDEKPRKEEKHQKPKKEEKQEKPKKQEKPEKNKKKRGGDSDQEEEKEKPAEKQQPSKKNKKNQKSKKRESSDNENGQSEDEQKPNKQSFEQEEENQSVKSPLNSHLMDEYLKETFLNVLKLSKVEAELPIDSGRFYMDYMILARPEGVKLDVKESSYKRLGVFYEQMAKKKFIEFKPAKEKKGQAGSTITKIMWDCEELKNYVPTIKRMGEKDVDDKPEEISKHKLKLSRTIQIDYVYRLNDDLKKILIKKPPVNHMPSVEEEERMEAEAENNKDKLDKEPYFTEKELKEKIERYINDISKKEKREEKADRADKAEKADKDKDEKKDKTVLIDYRQNELIYKLLKAEIDDYEQELAKEETMRPDSDDDNKKKKTTIKKGLFRIDRALIAAKIMRLASSSYQMTDKESGLAKFKQGQFKGIQIIAEKVINKNVTKIVGLEQFTHPNIEQEELVKQIHGFAQMLQVKYASSATVQNLPGKNAGKEIVVQGNFIDELESLFLAEHGIRKEFLTLQNKLGKKKKN